MSDMIIRDHFEDFINSEISKFKKIFEPGNITTAIEKGLDWTTPYSYLASLSHLAYSDEVNIKRVLPNNNVTYISFGDATAFIAEWDDKVVLSIQGTNPQSYYDVFDDLFCFKVPYGDDFVHAGFLDQAMNLVSWMIRNDYTLPDKKLIITGHSLGGAIAEVLSTLLKCDEVVTFGKPRVFVNKPQYRTDNITRFVNNKDIIPSAPFKWMGYNHFQDMTHIGNETYGPLYDHAIVNYVVNVYKYEIKTSS